MEQIANQVIFGLLALVIVVCSILTVTTRRILRAATYLLFVLFATAGIYFQLDYTFLGAVPIGRLCRWYRSLVRLLYLVDESPGRQIGIVDT